MTCEHVFVLRRCGRCGQELELSAFNRAGAGHQHWCRECFKDYFRARGDKHRAAVAASLAKRRASAREHVRAVLQRSACADSGEVDWGVLEFDHTAAKHIAVSALVNRGARLSVIDEEIAACDVVCRNCHRRRTAVRSEWRRARGAEALQDLPPLRRRNLAFVYAVLARGICADCGETDPLVLEFDHVGEKRKNVSDLAWTGYALETILKEICACVIRCCNCHIRRTSERAGDHRCQGYIPDAPL